MQLGVPCVHYLVKSGKLVMFAMLALSRYASKNIVKGNMFESFFANIFPQETVAMFSVKLLSEKV